jgi:chromosome segregation ATPase
MVDESAFKNKVQAKLAELRTLRDEIRLDVHLATMELRDEWKKLEKQLPDPSTVSDQFKDKASDLKERASDSAAELTGKAVEALDRLTTELKEFRERLRSQKG